MNGCVCFRSSHHGGDANSQVLGSFVLVWTDGDAPMDFKLSFPPPDARDTHRGNYLIHPLFTVSLSRGTLYVFSPLDDIFFCHSRLFFLLEPTAIAMHLCFGGSPLLGSSILITML